MKPELGPLTCRACGARPAQRGDDVSSIAQAYMCSRCLLVSVAQMEHHEACR